MATRVSAVSLSMSHESPSRTKVSVWVSSLSSPSLGLKVSWTVAVSVGGVGLRPCPTSTDSMLLQKVS